MYKFKEKMTEKEKKIKKKSNSRICEERRKSEL